jgi:hypothetical protein
MGFYDKWGEAVKAIVVMKPARTANPTDIINFHPRAHRPVQDAEIGRFHRRAAAEPIRQGPPPSSARSLLGG